jgi:hypothetical protein
MQASGPGGAKQDAVFRQLAGQACSVIRIPQAPGSGRVPATCIEPSRTRDDTELKSPDGDVRSLTTKTERNGILAGDLFVDCTGMASMNLGRHYGVGSRERADLLFNDSALAAQAPHWPDGFRPERAADFQASHCVGGSWFVSEEVISGGDFDAVGQAARAAMRVIDGAG